jgi:hypothetical protein
MYFLPTTLLLFLATALATPTLGLPAEFKQARAVAQLQERYLGGYGYARERPVDAVGASILLQRAFH